MSETKTFLFVLLLTIGISDCFILIDEIENQEKSHLIQAVVRIVHGFYSFNGSYFHVVNAAGEENLKETNDVIDGVVKLSSAVVQVEDVCGILRRQERKRYSVLVFIDSFKSFLKFLEKFSTKNFKFRRYFTVVLTREIEILEVAEIFDYFWYLSIKYVNLVMRHDSGGEIDLFTFFPFNEFNKCGDTTPVKINSFDKNTDEWKTDDFHPHKVKNLHKCPLVIGCAVGTAQPWLIDDMLPNGKVKLSGIEKDIFMEIAQHMNFRTKFEVHGKSPGSVFENGSATG
jgi:hypothetical protein